MKEKRKKIKERKAAAMAAARAKKATKTAETEAIAGRSSERDDVTQASKRIEVESSEPSRKIKNVHRTSLQTEGRRRVPKTSRENKGTTKISVPVKSKRKPQIRGATLA